MRFKEISAGGVVVDDGRVLVLENTSRDLISRSNFRLVTVGVIPIPAWNSADGRSRMTAR